MFNDYLVRGEFVGADMARKFLMMDGHARRYANHRDGKKYDDNGRIKPQETDHFTCDKAESARIFKVDMTQHEPTKHIETWFVNGEERRKTDGVKRIRHYS